MTPLSYRPTVGGAKGSHRDFSAITADLNESWRHPHNGVPYPTSAHKSATKAVILGSSPGAVRANLIRH